MTKLNGKIYLGAAVRTPIGKFGGGLSSLPAPALAEFSARETLKRAGIAPNAIDEVIFGCARQAGVGPNPARQVAFRSSVPASIPAHTINQACGSGLKAIISAAQAIIAGASNVVLAGGTESLSNAPYLLMNARWGYRLGHEKVVDAMYQDGYLCHLCDLIMGETADLLGEKYGISRHESDVFALLSQERYGKAAEKGMFDSELVPVEVSDRKSPLTVSRDEHPRPETTIEALAKLRPVFKRDGTVTAGNASGITDGAASMLVFSEAARQDFGLRPMARILDYAIAGVDPKEMGLGPVPAVRQLLERNKMKLREIDLVELNEAFAVQVLACDRELNFDFERLNVKGGAIALGHPTGCTGARITVTLLHEMARRGVSLGVATLCVSGGLGLAMLVEQV